MKQISRRAMLREAGGLARALAVGLPLVGDVSGQGRAAAQRLKVVVAGAHPDDPKTVGLRPIADLHEHGGAWAKDQESQRLIPINIATFHSI